MSDLLFAAISRVWSRCWEKPIGIFIDLKKGDKVTPEAQELFNKLKKEFSKKQAG